MAVTWKETRLTERDKAVDKLNNESKKVDVTRETHFMDFSMKMLEKRMAQARVGYLSMNLYDPPPAATWGEYNDRKISDTWVNDLFTSFQKSLGHAKEKNCIDVAIRPEWLKNRDAVLKTIDGLDMEEVPEMVFTDEGKAAMSPNKLLMLGGNHRRMAIRKYVDWIQEQIVLEEKVLKEMLKEAHSAVETQAAKIEDLKKDGDRACYWAVKIYDLGERIER